MIKYFTDFYKVNSAIVNDVIKIIIPCFLTYFFTSKNLTTPKRREIKQNQFDMVYLPLYLLMKQYNIGTDKEDASTFIKRVDKLIYKNYQYVYPKTISLYEKFKNQASIKNHNYYHVSTLTHQIEEDYEKLKMELGYPTNSILNNFKRFNKIDKILYVILLVLCSMLIYGVSAIYIYIIKGEWGNALINIPVVIFASLAIYTTVYIKRH